MKHRYWLYRRRGGLYYLQDAKTGKRRSLRTTDYFQAQRLRDAENQATEQPMLNLALGKAYLSAIDPTLAQRTWQTVIEEFCSRGQAVTRARNSRATASQDFSSLQKRKLVETSADDLRQVLKVTGTFNTHVLRCLHNLAVGMGWLPWPIIPPKLWPQPKEIPRRAITLEEHQRILFSEQDAERRLFYQLLWEIGASQSDAAGLTAAHIDWVNRTLIYARRKTGERACLIIGARLEGILKQLPATGPLFAKQSTLSASDRAAEFSRRCRVAGIKGVSLHCYRYSWAQRALHCAYPERFAQEALGHASKAVHRAYAKNSHVKIPPLEVYEKLRQEGNVIPLPLVAKENVASEATEPASTEQAECEHAIQR
jgi:integrase